MTPNTLLSSSGLENDDEALVEGDVETLGAGGEITWSGLLLASINAIRRYTILLINFRWGQSINKSTNLSLP